MTTTDTDQHAIRAEIDEHLDRAARAVQSALTAAEQYDDPAVWERLDAICADLRALETVLAAQS